MVRPLEETIGKLQPRGRLVCQVDDILSEGDLDGDADRTGRRFDCLYRDCQKKR